MPIRVLPALLLFLPALAACARPPASAELAMGPGCGPGVIADYSWGVFFDPHSAEVDPKYLLTLASLARRYRAEQDGRVHVVLGATPTARRRGRGTGT